MGALAICASKWHHYGPCMTTTERHALLAKRFIELSEQCRKQINADAVAWWKDEVRFNNQQCNVKQANSSSKNGFFSVKFSCCGFQREVLTEVRWSRKNGQLAI